MCFSKSALKKIASYNWFSYDPPLHWRLSKERSRKAFSQLCTTFGKPVQDLVCSCCKPIASQPSFQVTILHITWHITLYHVLLPLMTLQVHIEHTAHCQVNSIKLSKLIFPMERETLSYRDNKLNWFKEELSVSCHWKGVRLFLLAARNHELSSAVHTFSW